MHIDDPAALDALQDDNGDVLIDGPLSASIPLTIRGALNVEGTLSAPTLTVGRRLHVTGALDIAGDCTVGGGVSLRGGGQIAGALTVGDELSAAGGPLELGSADVEGGFRSTGALSAHGPLVVRGDLQLDDTLSAASDVSVGTFFNVEADAHIQGALTTGGFARISGDASIGGALQAGDDISVGASLRITGDADVSGSLTVVGRLDVSGSLTLGDMLRCDDTLTTGGDVSGRGDIHAQAFTVGGALSIDESIYLQDAGEASGGIRIGGSAFAKKLSAGGDVEVTGELVCESVERYVGAVPPLASIAYIHPVEPDPEPIPTPATWRGALRQLQRVMGRRGDRVAFLLGEAGVGKTTLLNSLARLLHTQGMKPVRIDLQATLRASLSGKGIATEIERSLGELSRHDDVVVLFDDLHYLSRGDYLVSEIVKGIRPFALHGALRMVFATTPVHYRVFFKEDALFGERTTVINLDELPRLELLDVVRRAALTTLVDDGFTLDDEAITAAVGLGSARASLLRPPSSALRLLDDARVEARLDGRTHIEAEDIRVVAPFKASEHGDFEISILRGLEDELNRQVLGQDDAVASVAKRIRLAKLGLDRRRGRPDGVFLLLGPSGVGKTELAKSVTRALYGDLSRLIRLDMSEYMAEHEYAKVIGPPPGYAGYGEEGQLTGAVERIGHGVVLLDEIEKAHRSLLNLFLQVFDEGHLTDSRGKRVDFSRCIIIMTSNIGRELWSSERKVLGFSQSVTPDEPSAKQVLNLLMRDLPPEFVNRVDVLVPFRALTREDLFTIVNKLIREEVDLWQKRGKLLSVHPDVLAFLVDEGYEPRLGARHLERNLERHLVQRISEAVLRESWGDVQRIHAIMRTPTEVGLDLS